MKDTACGKEKSGSQAGRKRIQGAGKLFGQATSDRCRPTFDPAGDAKAGYTCDHHSEEWTGNPKTDESSDEGSRRQQEQIAMGGSAQASFSPDLGHVSARAAPKPGLKELIGEHIPSVRGGGVPNQFRQAGELAGTPDPCLAPLGVSRPKHEAHADPPYEQPGEDGGKQGGLPKQKLAHPRRGQQSRQADRAQQAAGQDRVTVREELGHRSMSSRRIRRGGNSGEAEVKTGCKKYGLSFCGMS